MWLKENRSEAKKLFPAIGHRFFRNPNFTFTIIIGKRDNSHDWLEQRYELAQTLQIKIRSFDYFNDCIKNKFFQSETNFCSAEEGYLSPVQRNMLANPFATAYTDANWRKIVKKLGANTHFIVSNTDILLKYRQYNNLLKEFECL